MYLLVYVDDLIFTSNNEHVLTTFISHLNKEFVIKDLGDINYFLGLQVSYTADGLFLNQFKYTWEILERAKMLDDKPAPTLLSRNVFFTVSSAPYSDITHYQSSVGSLPYLTINKHDISYVVNQFS